VLPQISSGRFGEWHLAQDGPNKSTQLPGHGDHGFLPAEAFDLHLPETEAAMQATAALEEEPEAAMKPGLCFPAELLDQRWLMFLAFAQLFTDFGRQGVMLGTRDQKPACMSVATFGDCSPDGGSHRCSVRCSLTRAKP
jgi:hypothetical protein